MLCETVIHAQVCGGRRPGLLSAVLTDAAKTSYALLCVQGPCSEVPPGEDSVCPPEDASGRDDLTAPQRPAHKRPVQARSRVDDRGSSLSLKRRGIRLGNRPTPTLRSALRPALSHHNGATGACGSEQVAMAGCDGSSPA